MCIRGRCKNLPAHSLPKDYKLLQHAMTDLQMWSQKWLLSLNHNKCCVVSYGRSVDKSIRYTLVDHNNQEVALERNDKVKDLCVWFDEKLSFREHIQDKINKAYMICIDLQVLHFTR